ncbi:MAG: type II toxin-antitoxin system RelE/ParE family toxin [Alphaproteobacteria bacterium]|nr:type II toxin-antitoxin system RelE/ParE family toxin [Alphaproteobacteria bacterium]MBV9372698.1 type II toxin-antitoxin system RelE/ParE family toxin [Alphaproteobacteria bacterium]MBV9900677.1 type II toxin-antitoxin system RelE/ParE family toxin [Alphaproteobacteria bacterium]
MKGFLSERALADLAEIAGRIGRDSIPVARRFTSALRRRALDLARNPRLYSFEGFEAVGVRRRLYRDYLILHRERDGRVEVLHIVHASRDWSAVLDDLRL